MVLLKSIIHCIKTAKLIIRSAYRNIISILILILFSLSSTALTLDDIQKKASNSVYQILNFNFANNQPTNIVSGGSVAVTNKILATSCRILTTGRYTGVILEGRLVFALIIDANKNKDICLLYVSEAHFQPAPINTFESVNIGANVYSITFPFSTNTSILENYPSRGKILNVINNNKGSWIYSSTEIPIESSGGGLFDSSGNLIGIVIQSQENNKNITVSASTNWILQKLSNK